MEPMTIEVCDDCAYVNGTPHVLIANDPGADRVRQRLIIGDPMGKEEAQPAPAAPPAPVEANADDDTLTTANRRPATPRSALGNQDKVYPESDYFGWRALVGQINVRGTGPTDPVWAQIGSSPFSAYQFAVNDECWFAYHVPHDIVPSTDMHFHAHWLADGVDGNAVKWEFTYTHALGFAQEAYDLDGTVAVAEQSPPATAYVHMVTETTFQELGITEPDGIIYCRIRRVTNGAVDNADNIYLLTADIHYQSTSRGTIGRSPNFWRGATP